MEEGGWGRVYGPGREDVGGKLENRVWRRNGE